MAEREPVGVFGLDELMEGGFPKNSVVLLSGSAGTGKSIIAQQFVHHGATRYNQKGLYISFEQNTRDIFEQAARFGMDFKTLEDSGLVRFVFIDMSQRRIEEGKTHLDLIAEEIKRFQPKRVVVDSLTPLADFPMSVNELAYYFNLTDLDAVFPTGIQQDLSVRMQVHKLILMLKQLNVTALLTSEIPKNSEYFSSDGVSEFMADGVILLRYLDTGTEYNRTLTIEKLRATKHQDGALPFEITQKGVIVKKPEDAFKP